jgi:hypothetical protein
MAAESDISGVARNVGAYDTPTFSSSLRKFRKLKAFVGTQFRSEVCRDHVGI